MKVIFDQGDNQFIKVWKVLPEFWCFQEKTAAPIHCPLHGWMAFVFPIKALVLAFENNSAFWKTNMLWKENGSL